MTRVLAFTVVAAALVGYAFWIYLKVELRIPAGRWLAAVRATALVLILLLIFNPRLPLGGEGASASRWVLLDGSLSMQADDEEGVSAWSGARERALALEAEGWRLVRFGGDALATDSVVAVPPGGLESRLAPALSTAAEAGAREVRVLSDARLEDAVAVRSALEALPLQVAFETFGGPVPNAGLARFEVPDVPRPDEGPVAEVELFGTAVGDSVVVEIREEDRLVATVPMAVPSPGLRTTTRVPLSPPRVSGRARYTATVVVPEDGFAEDDVAVAYANVGFESGGLVLVSLRPDWEPRHLLPVLEEVTGLDASGYLRAGADRYLPSGRAVERGGPVDSTTVRRAAEEAAMVVLHGVGEGAEAWVEARARRGGRLLLLPVDAEGASLAGLETGPPRRGEWYVSPEVPTSPIAGSLAGASLEGLPPLDEVLVPASPLRLRPLQLQLRGAGAPESAFALLPGDEGVGRTVVVLASGFWRWAMRDGGRDAYRRIWSGVAGWLLADADVTGAVARPERWVFSRDEAVRWRLPADTARRRVTVSRGDTVVADTVVAGEGALELGPLPPAAYGYAVSDPAGDTVTTGRFDVASTTLEMLPRKEAPDVGNVGADAGSEDDDGGRPLRTLPWPYLLVIALLCGEWIVRRRSGLR